MNEVGLQIPILDRNRFHPIINRIPFHRFEAGSLDHFDDLLLGHFDFAPVGDEQRFDV